MFEALADPTRRALLQQLGTGTARVVDLAAEHPVTRPAISRHLRLLGEAGLVQATDVGRERHYELDPAPLSEIRAYLDGLESRPSRPEPSLTAQHLDALDTEVRRTRRDRRRRESAEHPTEMEDTA